MRSFKSKSTSAVLIAAALALTVGLAGCGGSDEPGSEAAPESASTELTGASLAAVCAGKQRIEDGIAALEDVDFSQTAPGSAVTSGVTDVSMGIVDIRKALDSLEPDQRAAVEKANDEFTEVYTPIGMDIGEAITADDPQKQLDDGVKQLSEAYDEAYPGIECP